MPIIRKLTTVGDARGITLPKSWIDFYEKESGTRITEVALEVNHKITVEPIMPKHQEQNHEQPSNSKPS